MRDTVLEQPKKILGGLKTQYELELPYQENRKQELTLPVLTMHMVAKPDQSPTFEVNRSKWYKQFCMS